MSLRSRLTVTHFILAVAVIGVFGTLAYRAAEMALFEQLRTEVLQTLYVHAAGFERLDRPEELKPGVMSLARAVNGRALVLNGIGRVVSDSLDEGSLVGKVLVLDEMPDALSGKAIWAVYQVQRGRFLYAAVPIEKTGRVEGVAFAAVRLEPIYRRLNRMIAGLVAPGLGLVLLAALASIGIGLLVGLPWARLVRVFETAPMADYRHRIPVRGRSELARLARAFNVMADRLQRTEQARRDFVVEASTELEMPLRAIIEVVNSEQIDPVQKVQVIGETAKTMSRTVEQLLDLARLEMDTDPLKPEVVDLGSLVNETLSTLQDEARAAGVALRRDDTIGKPVEITGDKKRLFAALAGLARYCIAAAETGGSVKISLAEDQNNAFFSVWGSRAGVAPEDMPFLFERFLVRRAVAGRDFLPEGGGGLAIARRVVELHGGAIEVKSTPTGGITFFARLPKKGLGDGIHVA